MAKKSGKSSWTSKSVTAASSDEEGLPFFALGLLTLPCLCSPLRCFPPLSLPLYFFPLSPALAFLSLTRPELANTHVFCALEIDQSKLTMERLELECQSKPSIQHGRVDWQDLFADNVLLVLRGPKGKKEESPAQPMLLPSPFASSIQVQVQRTSGHHFEHPRSKGFKAGRAKEGEPDGKKKFFRKK